jgi:hypothetical protein
VTAGIGITAHIPTSLKEKIWRDEYVELSALLPTQSHQFAEETITFSLCQEKNTNLGVKLNKPKPPKMNIQQWEDAFLVYMAVYTERHSVCPAMCTYMRDVKDMARRGANFQHYDQQFRIERAATHWTWDTVHQGLIFQATTPFRPFNARTQPTQPKRSPANSSTISPGYCFDYNTQGSYCVAGKDNNNKVCKYKHACSYCDGRHPVYLCTEKPNVNNARTIQPNPKPKQTPKDANPHPSK